MRSTLLSLILMTSGAFAATDSQCPFHTAGFRVGTDIEDEISLWSAEVFSEINSPWNWQLTEKLVLDIEFEAAIGIVDGEGQTAVYGSIGPEAKLSYGDFPLILAVSSSPALYSEDSYGKVDIGSNFQFISRIGVDWNINDTWTVGYRYQHTSNADLADPNPGLDMHTLAVAYQF
ncbi:acyloxyacyl hydrolase [Coraliomargarita parva]|uniref:acyloxyacyl hydrolase n=1 Tax=Coraliomargarita parva TaxID=3014050 RepID=UPI0022B55CFA|nr:acyloxyacyl hydrolase [Coraliomargarita parva]